MLQVNSFAYRSSVYGSVQSAGQPQDDQVVQEVLVVEGALGDLDTVGPGIAESIGAVVCDARGPRTSWWTTADPEFTDADSLLLLYASLLARSDHCEVARCTVTSAVGPVGGCTGAAGEAL